MCAKGLTWSPFQEFERTSWVGVTNFGKWISYFRIIRYPGTCYSNWIFGKWSTMYDPYLDSVALYDTIERD